MSPDTWSIAPVNFSLDHLESNSPYTSPVVQLSSGLCLLIHGPFLLLWTSVNDVAALYPGCEVESGLRCDQGWTGL